MESSPDIIPITDFRRDAAQIIGRIVASGQPVYVTQHGRLTAVLVSRVAYEGLLHRLAVLTAVPGGSAVPAAAAEAVVSESVGSDGGRVGLPSERVETRFGLVDPETADFLAVEGFGGEPAESGGERAPDEAIADQSGRPGSGAALKHAPGADRRCRS